MSAELVGKIVRRNTLELDLLLEGCICAAAQADAVVVSNSIDFSPSAPMSAPSVNPKIFFVSSS
jgi:hypothetical protein